VQSFCSNAESVQLLLNTVLHFSFADELAEAKEALGEANRKLHELDLENARLAGEVRELQTGLTETEDARRFAENRAQRALAELQALRVDMERRLTEKTEETEALRENLQFEIDRLTNALADAESRMKVEICRLKKKYQSEIAQLEVTVDNLNRANIEAQKTIKKQSDQLKVSGACVCCTVHSAFVCCCSGSIN
jgi:chromosome segregation ATPase